VQHVHRSGSSCSSNALHMTVNLYDYAKAINKVVQIKRSEVKCFNVNVKGDIN